MIPQISLIIPSIRPALYQGVYDSFLKTWHGSFEIIWVSPYDMPKLKTIPRGSCQFIKDFGCPSRALQLGFINARAQWLSFATDDCIFDSDTLNQAWRTLHRHEFDYKTVIVCKYTESDNWSKWMMTPFYYCAYFHADLRHSNIPFWFKIYMNGLISKQAMMDVGGFDTRFESMAYTYNDLSMRLQFNGCNFLIEKNRLDHCTWQPAENSDHSPVHHACLDHDRPLFQGVYWAKKFVPKVKIPIDNWKQCPAKWPRRYPNE